MAFSAAPTAVPTIQGPTVQGSIVDVLQKVIANGKSIDLTPEQVAAARAEGGGLLGGEMRVPSDLVAACKAGITLVSCTLTKSGAQFRRAKSGQSGYFAINYTTNDQRFAPASSGKVLLPNEVAVASLVAGQAFQIKLELQDDQETVYATANFA